MLDVGCFFTSALLLLRKAFSGGRSLWRRTRQHKAVKEVGAHAHLTVSASNCSSSLEDELYRKILFFLKSTSIRHACAGKLGQTSNIHQVLLIELQGRYN